MDSISKYPIDSYSTLLSEGQAHLKNALFGKLNVHLLSDYTLIVKYLSQTLYSIEEHHLQTPREEAVFYLQAEPPWGNAFISFSIIIEFQFSSRVKSK